MPDTGQRRRATSTSGRGSRGTRPRSRICAAVLLFFILAGLVEIHHHGLVPVRNVAGEASSCFDSAARHPDQPRHFEAADETESPACAACLGGLTVGSLQAAPVPTPQAATGGDCLHLDANRDPSAPFIPRGGGRSPPLA